MKKLFLLATLFFTLTLGTQAQSNQIPDLLAGLGTPTASTHTPTISGGLQQVYDAALGSTNFAVATGYLRSTKGQNNIGYLQYLYNFNQNVAAILGYDYAWTGHASTFDQSHLNFVKGGLNVQASIHPLARFGLTNFVATPFGAILISTSGGDVGQIIVGGVSVTLLHIGRLEWSVQGLYENRTGGNPQFDGVYVGGGTAFKLSF